MIVEPSDIARDTFKEAFPGFIHREQKEFMAHVNDYLWTTILKLGTIQEKLPTEFIFYLLSYFKIQARHEHASGIQAFKQNIEEEIREFGIKLPDLFPVQDFEYRAETFNRGRHQDIFFKNEILVRDRPLKNGVKSNYCRFNPAIFKRIRENIDPLIDDIHEFYRLDVRSQRKPDDATNHPGNGDQGLLLPSTRLYNPATVKRARGEYLHNVDRIAIELNSWIYHGESYVKDRLQSKDLDVFSAATMLFVNEEFPKYGGLIGKVTNSGKWLKKIIQNSNLKVDKILELIGSFPSLQGTFIDVLNDEPTLSMLFKDGDGNLNDFIGLLFKISKDDATSILKRMLQQVQTPWDAMRLASFLFNFDGFKEEIIINFLRLMGKRPAEKEFIEWLFRKYDAMEPWKDTYFSIDESLAADLQDTVSKLAEEFKKIGMTEIYKREDSPSGLIADILDLIINKMCKEYPVAFPTGIIEPILHFQLASIASCKTQEQFEARLSFIDTVLFLDSRLPASARMSMKMKSDIFKTSNLLKPLPWVRVELKTIDFLSQVLPSLFVEIGGKSLYYDAFDRHVSELSHLVLTNFCRTHPKDMIQTEKMARYLRVFVDRRDHSIFSTSTSGIQNMDHFLGIAYTLGIDDLEPFSDVFKPGNHENLMKVVDARDYHDCDSAFAFYLEHPQIPRVDFWNEIIQHPDWQKSLDQAYLDVIPKLFDFLEKHNPSLVRTVFTPKRVEQIIEYRLEKFKNSDTGEYAWDKGDIVEFFVQLVIIYEKVYPGEINHYRNLDDLVEFLFYSLRPARHLSFQQLIDLFEKIQPGIVGRIFDYDRFKETMFKSIHAMREIFSRDGFVEKGDAISCLQNIITKYANKAESDDFNRVAEEIEMLDSKVDLMFISESWKH